MSKLADLVQVVLEAERDDLRDGPEPYQALARAYLRSAEEVLRGMPSDISPEDAGAVAVALLSGIARELGIGAATWLGMMEWVDSTLARSEWDELDSIVAHPGIYR